MAVLRDVGFGRVRVAAAVCAALCLSAAPLFAQGGERVCSVKGIMGSVKVFSARDKNADAGVVGTWADARLNMPLRESDMVATLAESEVRLEMPDGSAVRLKENTVLELAALKAGGGTTNVKLKLVDGKLVTNVKKITDGKSTFEFETPTALAAVRGTSVEVESRKNHGTTIKTFDGKIEAGAAKSKNRAAVDDYRMVEVPASGRAENVRAVPSVYRPKTTKLLSEEDAAALTGFTRVILTYAELEEVKAMLELDGIPCGIGAGESDDEMTARTVSSDAARTELAKGIDTRVERLSEQYTQNVSGEAKKIWEEGVRQFTDVSVRGTSVHTTITQYNIKSNKYRVYSLMVMDPKRFKNTFLSATARQEEFELRVKKDELMSKMDDAIKAYDTKYHDR
jgi:hypothetical protein